MADNPIDRSRKVLFLACGDPEDLVEASIDLSEDADRCEDRRKDSKGTADQRVARQLREDLFDMMFDRRRCVRFDGGEDLLLGVFAGVRVSKKDSDARRQQEHHREERQS